MDEHSEIFTALGAAVAANCGPCFEHYYSKAEKLGIGKEDIQKTVDIAVRVRGGAHMVMKGVIQDLLKGDVTAGEAACCSGASTCGG